MGRSPWLMLAISLSITLVVVTAVGALEDNEHTPLPFDPLSPEEKDQAIKVTLASQAVDQQLSDRYELIGASLYTDKAFKEMEPWPRIAETLVYDYEDNLAIQTLVDLDEDSVISVEKLEIQPPLTENEAYRAGQMALNDDRVQKHLDEIDIDRDETDSIARLWTGPVETACPDNRCALVAFIEGDQYVSEVFILVDLTDEVVRDVPDFFENETHAEVLE